MCQGEPLCPRRHRRRIAEKVIRACRETGLLSDAEAKQALKMVDDRNLTTYTYDEAFVESLMGRFPEYDAVMHSWLEKLK